MINEMNIIFTEDLKSGVRAIRNKLRFNNKIKYNYQIIDVIEMLKENSAMIVHLRVRSMLRNPQMRTILYVIPKIHHEFIDNIKTELADRVSNVISILNDPEGKHKDIHSYFKIVI